MLGFCGFGALRPRLWLYPLVIGTIEADVGTPATNLRLTLRVAVDQTLIGWTAACFENLKHAVELRTCGHIGQKRQFARAASDELVARKSGLATAG